MHKNPFAKAIAIAVALLPIAAFGEAGTFPKLRVIAETDLGGDADDQASLVRFLLYSNEWDVEGIIADRHASDFTGDGAKDHLGLKVKDGHELALAYLDAYAEVQPNLAVHAAGFPTADRLRAVTVAGHRETDAGVNLIIRSADADDDRPIWYGNWGSNSGSESNLRRAFDKVKAERTPEAYEKFVRKFRICTLDGNGATKQGHDDKIALHIETGYPDWNGRWYHQFRPLTEAAGGFDAKRDVKTGHGALGALYTTPKEGDSWSFVYLIPNGLSDPEQPTWGSWGGRYGKRANPLPEGAKPADAGSPSGDAFFWANVADTWQGKTSRDNTAARWAAALQNDFKARLDWCVTDKFEAANHPPQPYLQDSTGREVITVKVACGKLISLTARGSKDPEGDALSFRWSVYPEAGSYTGEVAIRDLERSEAVLRVPTEAAGKTIHVILAVTDDGEPALTRYRRIIIEAGPPPQEMVPFLNPDESIAKMTYPEGFHIKAYASEPAIVQPFAFTFDDRGRCWVNENLNYETRGSDLYKNGPLGRIVILEDLDGDGVHDTRKVFIDGIYFPTGLAVGHGGVWVGSPPNLLFIPDRDGDDVPDSEPEIVNDGWGRQDRHETLNSFLWGPDGWLYGLHGVFTHSNIGKPGAPDSERQGLNAGVWRLHPETREFEVFAYGTSNPWGLDFDPYGQCFITACVIPHLWHMIQGGRYHRQGGQHFGAHIYDDIKTIADHRHQSAHGGARFYLADQFPEEYRGQLFMCNIHDHGILIDKVERQGSGYVGRHGDEFMMANDPQWLGFNLELGPDAALYALDWHDADICGRRVVHEETGRIFRISYGDPKPLEKFDLAKLSDAELVKMHTHANDWYVRAARRILHERAIAGKLEKGTHAALHKLFEEQAEIPRKLRALWSLRLTGGADDSFLIQQLDHADEHVRGWAIQFLAEGKNVSSAALAKWATMAESDPSAAVRLFLVSAMQRVPPDARWPVIEALAAHEEDAGDHNLPLMIWYALEPAVIADPARALKIATSTKLPRLTEFIARRLASEQLAVGPKRGVAVKPAKEVAPDGLALWFKPDAFESEKAGLVSQWTEGMRRDRHARQGEAKSWPKSEAKLQGRAAIRFDGIDDHLVVKHEPEISFTAGDDYSLSAWVYLDAPPERRWITILAKSRDQAPWYGLWTDDTGQWAFGSSAGNIQGGPALAGWHHLCGVQADGKRIFYVDGRRVADGNAVDVNGSGDFWIGGAATVEEYWRGELGEIRLYRRALSHPEVANLAEIPDDPQPIPARQSSELVALLGQSGDAHIHAAVLSGIRAAMKGWKQVDMPGGWPQAYASLAKSADPGVRTGALELALLFGDPDALAPLLATMKNAQAPVEERKRALQTLVAHRDRLSELAAVLRGLLDDATLRRDVIRALGQFADEATPPAVLARYAQMDAAEKADAVNMLSSRPDFALALLDAVAAKKIPRTDISVVVARQIGGLKDQQVEARLADVWGIAKARSGDKQKLIAEYKQRLNPEVIAKADTRHGRLIFSQVCAACHQIYGEGGMIGPDITGSNRADIDYILDTILDPNAAIGVDYQLTTIVTKDGRSLAGTIVEETPGALVLQLVNEKSTVAKSDIKERQRLPISMMPEGLLQSLKPDDVRDLIAYLRTKEQVQLPTPAP
jgi:putative membrane-bound dehydrogenase-like protein